MPPPLALTALADWIDVKARTTSSSRHATGAGELGAETMVERSLWRYRAASRTLARAGRQRRFVRTCKKLRWYRGNLWQLSEGGIWISISMIKFHFHLSGRFCSKLFRAVTVSVRTSSHENKNVPSIPILVPLRLAIPSRTFSSLESFIILIFGALKISHAVRWIDSSHFKDVDNMLWSQLMAHTLEDAHYGCYLLVRYGIVSMEWVRLHLLSRDIHTSQKSHRLTLQ